MSGGFTSTSVLSLKPEVADAFCKNFKEALAETRAFPGFRDIRALRGEDDSNKVILIEDWDSASDYEAYVKWRTETGMMEKMSQVLAGPSTRGRWAEDIAKD